MDVVKSISLVIMTLIVVAIPIVILWLFMRWAYKFYKSNQRQASLFGVIKKIEYYPIKIFYLSMLVTITANFFGYYFWNWVGDGIKFEDNFVANASLCLMNVEASDRINIWRNSVFISSLALILMFLKVFPLIQIMQEKLNKLKNRQGFILFNITLSGLIVFLINQTIQKFDSDLFCVEEYHRFDDVIFFSSITSVTVIFFYYLLTNIFAYISFNNNK